MSVGEFWPEKGVTVCEWDLNLQDSLPASLSGNSVSVMFGEPFYSVSVTVDVPSDDRELVKAWSSFFTRRQGSRNSFTMNRTYQSFPRLGGFDLSVDIDVTTANRASGQVRVTGHGNGRASVGDMFGYFTQNSGFYIGEIESVEQNLPSELIFTVFPRPFEPHDTTPAVRFIKAAGEFRLLERPTPTEESHNRGWSFQAVQVIRG